MSDLPYADFLARKQHSADAGGFAPLWLPDAAVLGGHWRQVKDGNSEAFRMFRRHYSAAKNPYPRQRQFIGPGEKLALLTWDGTALFAWRKERFRKDGQRGVNCAVFRNEGQTRSSDLIREAMAWAWERWPGERLFTMVDATAVRSTNPGFCFIKAGWRKCGVTKRRNLLILEAMPG